MQIIYDNSRYNLIFILYTFIEVCQKPNEFIKFQIGISNNIRLFLANIIM